MLAAGAKIQYRKVGRGVVQSHACAGIGYDCGQHTGDGGSHRYDVLFETGRYRTTTVAVWLRDIAAIPAPQTAAK